MAGVVKFDMFETQMQRSAQLGAEIAFRVHAGGVPATFSAVACSFFCVCLGDKCKLLFKLILMAWISYNLAEIV